MAIIPSLSSSSLTSVQVLSKQRLERIWPARLFYNPKSVWVSAKTCQWRKGKEFEWRIHTVALKMYLYTKSLMILGICDTHSGTSGNDFIFPIVSYHLWKITQRQFEQLYIYNFTKSTFKRLCWLSWCVCEVAQRSPGWQKAPVFKIPVGQDSELNAHTLTLLDPSQQWQAQFFYFTTCSNKVLKYTLSWNNFLTLVSDECRAHLKCRLNHSHSNHLHCT